MIEVCVIGVGYLGYHHARILKSFDNVRLVGVVDTNPKRAKEVGEEYEVEYFTDFRNVINKADAFIVAAPTSFHYEISKELIEEDKHVLIEKPVAANMDQAMKLLKLEEETDKIVTVGHIERFNPALKAFKKNVEYPFYFICERLGRFSNRALDVDVIKDLMVHDIDIVFSLVKNEHKEIKAVGIPVVTNSIDIANVIIEFADGSVANLTASRISAEKVRKVRVFQQNSYFTLDYTIQEATITKVYKSDIRRSPVNVDKAEPLKLELQNFIGSITGEEKQEIKLKEGVFALQIAEDISRLINERTKKISKRKD